MKKRPPGPPAMILSVDPGESAGWAWWNMTSPTDRSPAYFLLDAGTTQGDSASGIVNILDSSALAPSQLDVLVVIEDQWRRPGHQKASQFKTLVRRSAAWEILALARYPAARVVYINPQTWQAYLKIPHDREVIAGMSLAIARRRLPRLESVDAACAVCLGLFAWARAVWTVEKKTGGITPGGAKA